MMSMDSRADQVRGLIDLTPSTIALLDDFDSSRFDSLTERVEMKPGSLRSVLERYLSKELSGEQLTLWACEVESLSAVCIYYAEEAERSMRSVIYALANRDDDVELTPNFVEELVAELEGV